MNRRQILSGTTGAFGMLALPRIERSARGSLILRETPFAERSFRNRSGDAALPGITLLRCRVHMYRTTDRAKEAFEQHYDAETTPCEVEPWSEISCSGVTGFQLPLDMIEFPHRFATYATVAGAAAFRADHAVGVVRRGSIVWRYVIQGHGATELAEAIGGIAAAMVERKIGADEVTIDDRGQHHGSLWDLLPALGDIPGKLILASEASSDGRFDALGTPFPTTPDS